MVAQSSPAIWKVTQDLRIDGSVEGLSQIDQVIPMRNGTLVVPQGEDAKVRWFDSTGKPMGSFGRGGAGPQEFRMFGGVGIIGDTIWIVDPMMRRTTFVGPDMKFLRSSPWPLGVRIKASDEQGSPVPFGPQPLAYLPGGDYVAEIRLVSHTDLPDWYPKAPGATPLVRADGTGLIKRMLRVNGDGGECQVKYTNEYGGGGFQIPWCDAARADISKVDGRVAMMRIDAPAATSPEYRVTVIRASGDTVFSNTFRYNKQSIPGRMIDSARRVLATPRSKMVPVTKEKLAAVASIKWPTMLPPIRRLVIGRDDTVWLESWLLGPGAQWQILDSRGALVGSVKLPNGVKLLAADRNRIWASEKDEDDVPSVVRYRITPARP